jgi:uncharacterized membrane protein
MNSIKLEWPLIIAALLPWASIVVAALMTPRLTRPDLFFAVTVKASFRGSPAGREILARYDQLIVMAALLGLPFFGYIKSRPPLLRLGLFGPVAIAAAGFLAAFLVARRRTMPHHVEPTSEREAVLVPRQVSLPGGWLAQVGPFLILAAVCVCLGLNWNRIPARIPIHWGADGLPNGWAAKSPASVYGIAVIGALVCLLLAGLAWALPRGVRRIQSSGAGARREARFVHAVSLFLLGTEYWLVLLMGLLSLVALRPDPQAPLHAFWPILLGETLVVGTVFVIAYRMGQGGWRLGGTSETSDADNAPPVGDRTPDECWKLGLFYFNRNDPALWVEKRFGIGWTVNMANPRSWLVVGAIVLFVVVSLGLSLMIGRGG